MIAVPVFQRDPVTLEHQKNLGDFEFAQLPAPGDQFNIPHANGRVGLYRVICVAHEPLRVGEPRRDPERSSAFVHVAFLNEYW